MRYITGQHALNLPCSLETSGDWHTSGMRWDTIKFKESDDSIFKDYGIEICSCVPENPGDFYIANTLRALLDLLDDRKFALAQGAKEDYICNDAYTQEFFEGVYKLRRRKHWGRINHFMQYEYFFEWDEFLNAKGEYVPWMHRPPVVGIFDLLKMREEESKRDHS